MNPPELYGPERWAHQLQVYQRSRDAVYWALFMEQRTGKTPVIIDTMAHLYQSGKIDGVIMIAPNGTHADFVLDYVPQYLAREIAVRTIIWRANKFATSRAVAERDALLVHKGLAIVSINIDAIITVGARRYLAKFLKARRVMTVIDESLDISAPNAKRTHVAIEIGKRSIYRRILDGTAADAGPFGLYSQCEFLKERLLGFKSFFTFKHRYAEFEETWVMQRGKDGEFKERAFEKLASYKNLDELHAKLSKFSSRILREQCVDMPPKVYEKHTFVLTDKQQQLYDELKKTFTAELEDSVITAPLVLTRYLRLQQITSNFLPRPQGLIQCPECNPDRQVYSGYNPDQTCLRCEGIGYIPDSNEAKIIIDTINPRLDTMVAVINKLRPTEQVIIWSKFLHDRDLIEGWAIENGFSYARYDGTTPMEQRREGYNAFRDGRARLFISDQQAGGRGLDLSAAGCVIYYSHGWSLRFRRQSEDRAQNLAKKDPTLYVDIVAENSVDNNIVRALRDGAELAQLIMGDPKRKWL